MPTSMEYYHIPRLKNTFQIIFEVLSTNCFILFQQIKYIVSNGYHFFFISGWLCLFHIIIWIRISICIVLFIVILIFLFPFTVLIINFFSMLLCWFEILLYYGEREYLLHNKRYHTIAAINDIIRFYKTIYATSYYEKYEIYIINWQLKGLTNT